MKERITPEEIDVIKRAKAGSDSAFSWIYNTYKPFVDSLLYKYIKDKDESRDITNVVFLKVHDKLSKFTDYSSFGGWLRILTKNVAIDYLRTVKDSKSLDEDTSVSAIKSYIGDTEATYIDKMTYDNIVALFDKLPPSYREVCKMFYVDNMSIDHIHQALDMPKGTIKSDLHRGRKILRNLLKEDEHGKSNYVSTSVDNNLRGSPIQSKQ